MNEIINGASYSINVSVKGEFDRSVTDELVGNAMMTLEKLLAFYFDDVDFEIVQAEYDYDD